MITKRFGGIGKVEIVFKRKYVYVSKFDRKGKRISFIASPVNNFKLEMTLFRLTGEQRVKSREGALKRGVEKMKKQRGRIKCLKE